MNILPFFFNQLFKARTGRTEFRLCLGIIGNLALMTESEFCPPEHQKQTVCSFNEWPYYSFQSTFKRKDREDRVPTLSGNNWESLTNDRIGILSSRTSKSKLFAHLMNDHTIPFHSTFKRKNLEDRVPTLSGNNWESHTFDRIGILSSRTASADSLLNQWMNLPFLFNRLFKQGQGGKSSDSVDGYQESLTNDRIGILSSRTSKANCLLI